MEKIKWENFNAISLNQTNNITVYKNKKRIGTITRKEFEKMQELHLIE